MDPKFVELTPDVAVRTILQNTNKTKSAPWYSYQVQTYEAYHVRNTQYFAKDKTHKTQDTPKINSTHNIYQVPDQELRKIRKSQGGLLTPLAQHSPQNPSG